MLLRQYFDTGVCMYITLISRCCVLGQIFFVVVFFKFFFKVTYKAHCVSCDNGNELKPSGIGQSDPNTVLGTSAQSGLRANLPPVVTPNGLSQSKCRSTIRKSASAPFNHRNLLDPQSIPSWVLHACPSFFLYCDNCTPMATGLEMTRPAY